MVGARFVPSNRLASANPSDPSMSSDTSRRPSTSGRPVSAPTPNGAWPILARDSCTRLKPSRSSPDTDPRRAVHSRMWCPVARSIGTFPGDRQPAHSAVWSGAHTGTSTSPRPSKVRSRAQSASFHAAVATTPL